jgi:CheY-like chemotaxis protein
VPFPSIERLDVCFAVADDGLSALETLNSQTKYCFDAILMDCQMPRLDGYETTKTIRHSPAMSKFANIPIIH